MLLIVVMGGLGLLRLEFTLLWAIDGPSLVSWAPKVSLVVNFLGVSLSIFWVLLLPVFFPFSILVLFSCRFMALVLDFSFAFSFD